MKTLAVVIAAGAPAAASSDLTLASPKTVNGPTFTIVLHSDTLTARLRLESDVGPHYAQRFSNVDANGDYHFAEKISQGGTYHFQAYPAGQPDAPGTLLYSFKLVVSSKVRLTLESLGVGPRGLTVVGTAHSATRACAAGEPVAAERLVSGRWVVVGHARGGRGRVGQGGLGSVLVQTSVVRARYRLVARKRKLPGGDICRAAVSNTKFGPPGG